MFSSSDQELAVTHLCYIVECTDILRRDGYGTYS
uniref:Uncharacterized protein n=1 Tax=Arundo donax TaxID=35708 RepID=A0A0A9F3F2_ARUDO